MATARCQHHTLTTHSPRAAPPTPWPGFSGAFAVTGQRQDCARAVFFLHFFCTSAELSRGDLVTARGREAHGPTAVRRGRRDEPWTFRRNFVGVKKRVLEPKSVNSQPIADCPPEPQARTGRARSYDGTWRHGACQRGGGRKLWSNCGQPMAEPGQVARRKKGECKEDGKARAMSVRDVINILSISCQYPVLTWSGAGQRLVKVWSKSGQDGHR